jgi:DNA-binding transcriptional MerR regulator
MLCKKSGEQMQRLTVGQMAKINGVSAQALRLYDRIGLLKPASLDEKTGYRYYDIRQSTSLDIIQYMKSLGISLKEIKAQLEEHDIDITTSRLHERIAEIEEQTVALRVTKNAVKNMIRSLEAYKAISEQGIIVVEEIPERMIHSYNISENFYVKGPAYYEMVLREMKNDLLLKKLPISYFCNVGSIIEKERFIKHDYVSTKIFIWADEFSSSILPADVIPAASFLCIYFEGFSNEKRFREALTERIESSDLTVTGDFICETIAEFPVYRKAERNTIIKLQIPFKKNSKTY